MKHAFIAAASLCIGSTAFAEVVVDGTADAAYGTALAVQTVHTGFGNATDGGATGNCNGSELDGAFGLVDSAGGFLYIVLAGNMESNFNKLDIFIDCRADAGQAELRNNNPDMDFNNLNRMGYCVDGAGAPDPLQPGLKFDAGFAADAAIFATLGGGNAGAVPPVASTMYVNFGQLLTDGAGVGGYVGNSAYDAATGVHALGANSYGLEMALNNANVGGVSGDAANPGSGDGVTTGLEIKVPLAVIDWDGSSPIKVCAFINGGNHDYMSNQVLGPLPPGSGNPGGDGVGGWLGGNSCAIMRIDFAGIPGDQFFVIGGGSGPNNCPGDFDNDGFVSGGDLGTLLGQWGQCSGACSADFDNDGFVSGGDLGTLLGAWGACPN